MHICPSIDYVERAWDDAKYGRPSQNPLLEMTCPTIYEPGLAPAGKHIMGIFLQYAPYTLREGTWDERRDVLLQRVVSKIEEYVPNFGVTVEAAQVLTPLDLERTYGLKNKGPEGAPSVVDDQTPLTTSCVKPPPNDVGNS